MSHQTSKSGIQPASPARSPYHLYIRKRNLYDLPTVSTHLRQSTRRPDSRLISCGCRNTVWPADTSAAGTPYSTGVCHEVIPSFHTSPASNLVKCHSGPQLHHYGGKCQACLCHTAEDSTHTLYAPVVLWQTLESLLRHAYCAAFMTQ